MIDLKYLLSAWSIWYYLCQNGLNIFDISFLNFSRRNFVYRINVCLNTVEYWIYIVHVFSFTIMILFLLSFLGILSVWSDILQEMEIVLKIKTGVPKFKEISIKNVGNILMTTFWILTVILASIHCINIINFHFN